MKRKVIQIATIPDNKNIYSHLVALCDDGTIWIKALNGEESWRKIEDIPQF